jgi:hypothetical protein
VAFDPAGAEGFIKQHPVGVAVGGLAIVLVVWYLVSSGSSTTTAASGSTDDTATEAAAALQAAQVTANSQTAAATIAAGVTNNQTAAAQTVALAQLQSTNDGNAAAATASVANAYYGAATDISANNSAVAVAGIGAQAAEQQDQDTLLSSEFGNLASVLTSFGNNTQSIVNNTTNASVSLGQGMASPATGYSSLFSNLLPITGGAIGGGSPFDTITQALLGQSAINSTVDQNATIIGIDTGLTQNAMNNSSNFANSALQSNAATTGGTISNFGSWITGLLGSFGSSQTASAPVTPSVNVSGVVAQNIAPLSNSPPQVASSTITPFE